MLTRPVAWTLAGVLLLLVIGTARAADVDVRDFAIQMDGKPAGQFRMTITRQDDGSATMLGAASYHAPALGGLLRRSCVWNCTETWKEDRLLILDSTSGDNSRRTAIAATADAGGLRLRVNGAERRARPDLWVTTFWRLPPVALRNRPVALLDAETGRELTATLKYIDGNPLVKGGQSHPAAHYRISGQVQVDLWYDSLERLVRKEWRDSERRMVMELTGRR